MIKREILFFIMIVLEMAFVFSSCMKKTVEKPNGDIIIQDAVTDIDGNTYDAVKLGGQVWMAENLRTTKYSDGTSIQLGNSTSASTLTPLRYYPNNNSANVSTYGYLYNWKAVMEHYQSSIHIPSGVQGICPDGWHVPSSEEWDRLISYVSTVSAYICGDEDGDYSVNALASTIGWKSCKREFCPGYNPSENNATDFSALPAGYFSDSDNAFGEEAVFWTSFQNSTTRAFYWKLRYDFDCVERDIADKTFGMSVRCVKD